LLRKMGDEIPRFSARELLRISTPSMKPRRSSTVC
jgi:hypothetical protein